MTYAPRQVPTLRFILETQRERESYPSVREICEHLGGRDVPESGLVTRFIGRGAVCLQRASNRR